MAWSETEGRCVYAAWNIAEMYGTVLSVPYVFHFGKKDITEVVVLNFLMRVRKIAKSDN